MKKIRNITRMCNHYRQMMSECRNCDPSDAPYKICYERRSSSKENHHKTFYNTDDYLEE